MLKNVYILYLCRNTYIYKSKILIFAFFRATVRELIETEEEFSRDLQNIVDRYIRAVDKIAAPRIVRDSKDIIFSNFEQIAEFHNM